MAIRNVKAVIFDLDDTLYDRNAVLIGIAGYLYQNLPRVFIGHEMKAVTSAYLENDRTAEEDYGAGVPWTRDEYFRRLLRSLGIDEHHTESVTEMYNRNRDQNTMHMPVPGAAATLEEIRRNFKTALITGGFSDGRQNIKLKAIGLAKYMDYAVFGEELGISKPDPAIFQYTADLLDIPPAECIYIGDSYERDVTGAKNAGMLACWYNPGKISPPESTNIRPDFIIEALPELLSMLSISLTPECCE